MTVLPTDPKRTVKAKKVDAFRYDCEPGDCILYGDRLMFGCPGCGLWGGVNAGHPKPAQGPSWDIVSGTLDDPEHLTLSPSIHCIGCCGWHGHLKDGTFVPC